MESGKSKKAEQKQRLETLNALLEERRSKLEGLKVKKEEAEAPEKAAKDKHQQEWDVVKEKLAAEKTAKDSMDAFGLLDTNNDGSLTINELLNNNHLSKELDEAEASDMLGGASHVTNDGFAGLWNTFQSKFLKDGRPQPPAEDREEKSEEHADLQEESAPKESEENPVDIPPKESEEKGESDGQPVSHSNIKTPDIDENVEESNDDNNDEQENYERMLDNEGEKDDDDEEEDADAVDQYVETKKEEPKDPEMPDYDDETKLLIEAAEQARRDFEEAERLVNDAEREQRQVNDYMDKDYGPDEEFQSLHGQCFEISDREYTYKLCPFDKVTQRQKSGGAETDLGRWGSWVGSDNKYAGMKYEGGQGCWKGPSRSTVVDLACGSENKIISVGEPNRCEYAMQFITPAMCQEVKHLDHTEL